MFGLTPTGYNRKRASDYISEIQTELNNRFGSLNFQPDSVAGNLVDIVANRFAEIEQNILEVYLSGYLPTATGTSLDLIANLLGFTRNPATPTTVPVTFFAPNNTSVTNSITLSDSDGNQFTVADNFLVSQSQTYRLILDVDVQNSTEYEIVIDGESYTYTSSGSATASEILDEFEDLINADNLMTASVDDDTLVLTSTIGTQNRNVTFDNFTINQVGTMQIVTLIETGAIFVPENTVTIITSQTQGVTSVNNFVDGITGSNLETDTEFRDRIESSNQVSFVCVEDAIRARLLQNVPEIQSVTIFSNRTNQTVNGRPPHSYETIVLGGNAQIIAQEIWDSAPAGIEPFGDTIINATDSQGRLQAVGFTRPEELYIFINVTLTTVNTFPAGGEAVVADNLKAKGDELGVGQDVIWQTFFEEIYKVQGITSANLTFASSSDPNIPGSFSAANISVEDTEIALFDLSRINVSV